MMFRSLLYVPASSERFIAKAHERGADAIILDLEDSVLPEDKEAARRALAESVPRVAQGGATVFVRINAEPERALPDAEAAARARAFGLYVPKARSPQMFDDLDQHLKPIESAIGREPLRFVALIEDAAGVLDARLIAQAPRVIGLTAGSEDLALSMGARPEPEVLRLPKLLVHYAAKAEGLLSFGLFRSIADYGDHDAAAAAAREARAFGFDGASCVHPALVPILNSGFSPSPQEIVWARKVLAAGVAGAFAVDGSMADAPVIERARRLLRRLPEAEE
jgi:citrate lyase subunit beta / citryl-CoA lyase